MKLFTSKKKLQTEIKNINNISFVPTMGALHKGHISLIKKSVKKSKKTLVSIFVNPKQFDNKKDFNSYPKSYKKDIKILKRLRVSYLYKPTYADIYKFKTKNKIFLDQSSKILCGKYRKGHFIGVIDVVNRLLEIIKPKKIFLGKKDFQQLFLIKKHIIKNKINTKVIPCKTIRDKYFVAYSSRLKKIKKKEKIYLIRAIKVLRNYKKFIISKKTNYNFNKIKNAILSVGLKKVEYVEPININTFRKTKKNKFNLFFAFYVGKVRFIDNF
tara:strand:+ start:34 stop:843 length:810 start_codon:yes stop_codon:yes gene_type:complete